jgi:hypothetical protein
MEYFRKTEYLRKQMDFFQRLATFIDEIIFKG